jgi:hypothetical protein
MTPGADGHRYFEELAVSHVVGGLDDSEGRIFRAHLLECSECRAQVGELRAIAHDLADIERDERRVRAAKAIETKRRETDEEEQSEEELPPTTRASRIGVVVGLVLLLGLAAWNFTLRGTVEQLAEANRRGVDASGVLALGEAWDVVRESQVQGTIRKLGHKVVAYVVNAVPNRTYGIYLYNADDQLLWTLPIPVPDDGRFLVMPEEDMGAATRVVITDPGPNQVPSEDSPSGTVLLEAKLQQPAHR